MFGPHFATNKSEQLRSENLFHLNSKIMLNKIKHSVFAMILFIAFPNFLNAQKFEIGIGIGASIFQGDLGGIMKNGAYKTWDIDLNSTRAMGQIMVKYSVVPNIKVRGNIAVAMISGNDKYAGNPEILERGVAMDGNVFQGALILEIGLVSNHQIYGILGLGYAGYNVSTYIKGVNQNTPFSHSLSIPVGLGVHLANIGNGKLELEAVAHYLNSDLVDGYSGPNSYSNDTYTFLGINYNIPIGYNYKKYGPTRNKKLISFNKLECPEF